MASTVEVIIEGVDKFSGVLGNFGNIMTGIKSTIDLVADAFHAVQDAIQPFIDSASDSQIALVGLDTILASTASGAGLFTETIGKLSETSLLSLQVELDHAKDKLGEMKDAYGNVKSYTDEETLAIMLQKEKIADLTAQIERGTDGLTIYKDTTQLSRDALIELASALQLVTKFSDEEILSAEAMMLRFENVNSTIFPEAIRLTTDLATFLGVDLTAAARVVGMALDDPEQGIGRLNLQFRMFNETEMETIKNMAANGDIAGAQALIIEKLTEKVGGMAEAYGKTFAGAIDIAKNKMDEIKETIGNAMLPILSDLLAKLMEFVDTNPIIQSVLGFFQRFADLMNSEGDIPFLGALGAALMTLENLSPAFYDLGYALILFQGALVTGSTPLEAFKKALDDLALNDGPLGKIATFISDLVTTFESSGWSGVWDKVKEKILEGWAVLAPIIDDLFAKIFSWMEEKIDDWIADGGPGRVSDKIIGALSTYIATPEFQGKASVAAQALIDTLGKALGLIDWDKLWAASDEAMYTAFENLGIAVADVFSAAVRGALSIAFPWFEIGKDILEGLFAGMSSLEIDATAWVREHIVDPIKRFLGIASRSTVFYEIGKNIIQGLWDGMASMWNSFVDWIAAGLDAILAVLTPQKLLEIAMTDLTLAEALQGAYTTGGTSSTGGATGSSSLGSTSTSGTGTVINQYFAGATINVGSWDEITYDCIYPNPFISATSGQLSGGGTATMR
jgi:hypothetical protein